MDKLRGDIPITFSRVLGHIISYHSQHSCLDTYKHQRIKSSEEVMTTIWISVSMIYCVLLIMLLRWFKQFEVIGRQDRTIERVVLRICAFVIELGAPNSLLLPGHCVSCWWLISADTVPSNNKNQVALGIFPDEPCFDSVQLVLTESPGIAKVSSNWYC